MAQSRLKSFYVEKLRPELGKSLNKKNVMEIPKISKIVLNAGVKEAVADSRILQSVEDVMARIAGQAPVKTLAKKSIAGFKIREGMPLGVMVTLRQDRMYEFLDKLINIVLPKVRDFQGVSTKFDGRGGYNLGIKEWGVFPEADQGSTEVVHGMNISIQTTAVNDEDALALLKGFGMPFRKDQKAGR